MVASLYRGSEESWQLAPSMISVLQRLGKELGDFYSMAAWYQRKSRARECGIIFDYLLASFGVTSHELVYMVAALSRSISVFH